jgi:hypothetical protein
MSEALDAALSFTAGCIANWCGPTVTSYYGQMRHALGDNPEPFNPFLVQDFPKIRLASKMGGALLVVEFGLHRFSLTGRWIIGYKLRLIKHVSV